MSAFEPYKMIAEIVVKPNAKGTGVELEYYFECDGTACRHCEPEYCYLTKDVRHARHFSIFDSPTRGGEREKGGPERDRSGAGGGEAV